jgi:hypothetical protein
VLGPDLDLREVVEAGGFASRVPAAHDDQNLQIEVNAGRMTVEVFSTDFMRRSGCDPGIDQRAVLLIRTETLPER